MDVGVHFVHQGNSHAHGGFVVATADVAFAAEFGAVAAAVVAVAVSFVAAAHAVFVAAAAAVAVAAHAVDAE